jgi:hypothetical protein
MSNPIASMVNLISNIANNTQLDDTDPNNTAIQLFVSPDETMTFVTQNWTQIWTQPAPVESTNTHDTVTTMIWGTSGFLWVSSQIGTTFNWNQGGFYS